MQLSHDLYSRDSALIETNSGCHLSETQIKSCNKMFAYCRCEGCNGQVLYKHEDKFNSETRY